MPAVLPLPSPHSYDWGRTTRLAVFNAGMGVLGHEYYKVLDGVSQALLLPLLPLPPLQLLPNLELLLLPPLLMPLPPLLPLLRNKRLAGWAAWCELSGRGAGRRAGSARRVGAAKPLPAPRRPAPLDSTPAPLPPLPPIRSA